MNDYARKKFIEAVLRNMACTVDADASPIEVSYLALEVPASDIFAEIEVVRDKKRYTISLTEAES